VDPAQALVASPPFDRTTGVGGTDAAAILNLYPWRDPLDVWMEKTHHPMWSPAAENEAMRWGKILEPVILARYCEAEGRSVIPGEPWDAEPRWSEDHVRFIHPDGYVLGADGVEGLWEGKTSSNPEAWEQGVPDYYQVQVQQGMDILGLPWCDVSVLINTSDFRTYRILADADLQARIRSEVDTFWAAVMTGVWDFTPLPPLLAYPTDDPALPVLTADEELNAAAKTLLEIKRRIAELTTSGEKTRDAIERIVKDHPGATGDGWYLDWKDSKPPVTTDWYSVAVSLWNALESIRRDLGYGVRNDELPPKVVAMLDPTLYAILKGMYTLTGKSTRPFNLKAGDRK